MSVSRTFVDAFIRVEEALDRLKLAYKRRFDRFSPAAIVPYRGLGRPDLLVVRGRVLEANEMGFEPEPGLWTNMRNTWRRLETDEIRGARIRARFRSQVEQVEADDEAFFEVRLRPDPPVGPGWHNVDLEIVESMAGETDGPATAQVLVPAGEADFAVVSDLDDTVLRTGASDTLTMIRTILLNDARTRLPFQGVAEFYRALEAGPSGGKANPIVYLSRSPWNLYPMLAGFMEHHELPRGPLLLKEYGLRGILGSPEKTFKRDTLRDLLDFWDELPFVLIGDSGQSDPEIYRDLVLEHPERIRAVIIRDVTPECRDREVRGMAAEIESRGVPVILASDSAEAARHAAEIGLIDPARVPEVEADRSSEQEAPGALQRMFG